MSVWLISDTHFYHSNIILYEKRPFSNKIEMNEVMINNWKKVVRKNDTIFHLGDVGFGSKCMMYELISDLPGRKILVMGNHDKQHSLSWWQGVGFDEVYKYPIIYEGFYILSHEPLYVGQEMPYVNIHGHTHSESSDNKQKVNVSVEVINYTPVNFNVIKNKFTKEGE